MTVSTADRVVRDTPVRENVARLKSRLRRSIPAMEWLLSLGLGGATVDRLHLGLKEPYSPRDGGDPVVDPLSIPHLDEAMRPLSRYSYLRVPGVTEGGPDVPAWGPGQCATYRLGATGVAAIAAVAADITDCWLAWQELAKVGLHDVAVICRSQSHGIPAEWRTPEFWNGFGRVVVLPGSGATELLRALAPYVLPRIHRVELPPPLASLLDVRNSSIDLRKILDHAPEWVPDIVAGPFDAGRSPTGRFAAAPVDITGAHVAGHSYYPFCVEERVMEDVLCGGRLVQSYSTLVLRSDGLLLEVMSMPAPTGTDARRRVIALSDGTRITAAPSPGQRSTWSHKSIESYIAWTRGDERPFRGLPDIIADVELFLRSRVGLPYDGHYLLAALYVVLSHVFQVFDAIPILLVNGPSGSGKSELADAIARLGFNASMAGQLRAAGMIRLIDETRGLLVLDDVDGVGHASITGSGELAQTLKMAYKRSTARKPLADRTGRVRMADFYGPKVLTNVGGADAVLGARLMVVRTALIPNFRPAGAGAWTEAALDRLRDELHCWGLAEAGAVADASTALGDAYRDRRQEIAAPLRALARYAGDEELAWRISGLLSDETTFWPGK